MEDELLAFCIGWSILAHFIITMLSKSIKLSGWAVVLSTSIFFIYNNALRYFNEASPAYNEQDLKPFMPVLMIHIAGGIIALLIGPWQFVSSIRRKYTNVHRMMGRIYLSAILVSGLAGLYLAIFHAIIAKQYITFGVGLSGLALAWLLTSGAAFRAILKRNFVQHREWMIRSYVVTCGFTTFRIVFGILNMFVPISVVDSANISAWGCWAVPLLVTEFFLQKNKITGDQLRNVKHRLDISRNVTTNISPF